MTDRSDLSRDRIEVALDRATRVVRLLTWAAMFVLVCLMLWVVSGMAARAEDPKAAAGAIGAGGNSAARAIARDSTNAETVTACWSRGCAEDPAPPHDRITGNIGLVAALEAVAEEGDAGRDVARRHLERRGRER